MTTVYLLALARSFRRVTHSPTKDAISVQYDLNMILEPSSEVSGTCTRLSITE